MHAPRPSRTSLLHPTNRDPSDLPHRALKADKNGTSGARLFGWRFERGQAAFFGVKNSVTLDSNDLTPLEPAMDADEKVPLTSAGIGDAGRRTSGGAGEQSAWESAADTGGGSTPWRRGGGMGSASRILSNSRPLIAEFLGAFVVAFCAGSAMFVSGTLSQETMTTGRALVVCLVHALAFGSAQYSSSFLHVPVGFNSGVARGGLKLSVRHLTPSVTIALYLFGRLDAAVGRGGDEHRPRGVRHSFLIQDVLYTVFAQGTGSLMGVVAAINVVPDAHDVDLRAPVEGVTASNLWLVTSLASAAATLTLVVVCYAPAAQAAVIAQRLRVQTLRERNPQSSQEVGGVVASAVVFGASAAVFLLAAAPLDPFLVAWLSLFAYGSPSDAALIWGPILGALGAGCVVAAYACCSSVAELRDRGSA